MQRMRVKALRFTYGIEKSLHAVICWIIFIMSKRQPREEEGGEREEKTNTDTHDASDDRGV
ncbi:hypothetical protein ACK3Z9_10340 [Aeromonas caviae]|jgi:hypothetical protein|uniref:hypothetical protein n=1 Tax=Aeromonas TaxID=642 RepID=UPI001C59AA32|nr:MULTISPECIES: hypothetical protein [Aeromonas]QXW30909.1 hypothetical protein KXJ75_07605 [Aeromonas sanarellii]WEA31725.1 hypothetical protein PWO56_07925 [Aeromonas hydrophila]